MWVQPLRVSIVYVSGSCFQVRAVVLDDSVRPARLRGQGDGAAVGQSGSAGAAGGAADGALPGPQHVERDAGRHGGGERRQENLDPPSRHLPPHLRRHRADSPGLHRVAEVQARQVSTVHYLSYYHLNPER